MEEQDTILSEQARPELTDEQLGAVKAFGEVIDLPAGAELFRKGDRNVDFYVVIRGAVEVSETASCGKKRILATHRDRNFTGELNLFNTSKVLVDARTSVPSQLLRVRRHDFRRMLNAEPEIAKMMLRVFAFRRGLFIRNNLGGVTLIGVNQNSDTLRIRQFLFGNGYPCRVVGPDAQGENGKPLLACLSLSPSDLPVVWTAQGSVLKNPSIAELASELGLHDELVPGRNYDVAIVGGGPSGLAASVYAASEGLDTVLIEAVAPGGQAGTSSQIENYLGFPDGISGQELAALAQVQAEKFGVHIAVARSVKAVDKNEEGLFELKLSDEQKVLARSVIVASGAKYRRLDLQGYERFEGSGIHYAATVMESNLCTGEEVVVVGGGNSAGQAAVYLSQSVSKVHMLVRGKNLSSSMSSYLIERIEAAPRIQVYYETEITQFLGEKSLEQVQWKNCVDGRAWTRPTRNVFVMIGAIPNTEWLRGCIDLDEKGFVLTGLTQKGGPLNSPFETEEPGLFAVGDVRAESVKRVASAVGEGSVVLQWVHRYLAETTKVDSEPKAA